MVLFFSGTFVVNFLIFISYFLVEFWWLFFVVVFFCGSFFSVNLVALFLVEISGSLVFLY